MYECRFLVRFGSFPDWRFYSKPRGYIVVILRTVYRTRVRQLPSVSSPICPNRWIIFRPMHQKSSRVYCDQQNVGNQMRWDTHSRPPSRWKRMPLASTSQSLESKHAFVARGA